MTPLRSRYTKNEFARRGRDLFDREVMPRVAPTDDGAFVAIDIESGEYEIDRDDRTATDRLLARIPDPQIWLSRIGHCATYRIGGRPLGGSPVISGHVNTG